LDINEHYERYLPPDSHSGMHCLPIFAHCGCRAVTAEVEHEQWMRRALALADRAENEGEVPIGAVVVRDGKLLGEGWNSVIALNDPTAHAEIVAMRDAARLVGNYRLPGATVYVTLEPCTMCAGAMIHARIEKLVYAANEPRAGVVCSTCSLLDEPRYNHRVSWQGGVLAEDSSQRLQAFFRRRRK
jgi:tRNA(adenine34) deaminase